MANSNIIVSPQLSISQVTDQYIRKNFQNLQSYFQAQNQFLNFKFFDITFTQSTSSQNVAHGLGCLPQDIVVMNCVGSGQFNVNFGLSTSTNLNLSTTGPMRVRFFIGTYWNFQTSYQFASTDTMSFTANPSGVVPTPVVTTTSSSSATPSLQQVFLTSGVSWSAPANITTSTKFKISIIGGGGGGGGAKGAAAAAAGGASGGYGLLWLTGINPSAEYAYAIGAGGGGGSNTGGGGGGGGTTSITISGTTYSATGGGGGAGGTSGATSDTLVGSGQPGVGQKCTINNPGIYGQLGFQFTAGTSVGGNGAPGPWGGYAFAVGGATAGSSGLGFGAAGGGAASNSAATGQVGGNAAAGCILIEYIA